MFYLWFRYELFVFSSIFHIFFVSFIGFLISQSQQKESTILAMSIKEKKMKEDFTTNSRVSPALYVFILVFFLHYVLLTLGINVK